MREVQQPRYARALSLLFQEVCNVTNPFLWFLCALTALATGRWHYGGGYCIHCGRRLERPTSEAAWRAMVVLDFLDEQEKRR
jgi:hypothetical protein